MTPIRCLLLIVALSVMASAYATPNPKISSPQEQARAATEATVKDKEEKAKALEREKQNIEAREKQHLEYEGRITKATEKVSDFNLGLIFVGVLQAFVLAIQVLIFWRQETATKTIERAYVQISHLSNEIPGLDIHPAGVCLAQINVKNHGSTPARITRVFLTRRLLMDEQLLPDIPDYRAEEGDPIEPPTEAFLVKGGDVTIGYEFNIAVADVPLVNQGEKRLFIYGFADYTDQFGRDFRAGYGRRYQPGLPGNNLVFITQPRYNYDCERENDRCKSWPS